MIFINSSWYRIKCSDVDVIAFVNATSITDVTIISALCVLVTSLKNNGLWTKFNAVYPLVGGTATTHKFNLKNPLDTTTAFRLNFTGGWTHSANGITGNGLNANASTFVSNTILTTTSSHISSYSRTNIEESSVDIGSGDFFGGIHHSPRYTAIGAFFRTFLTGTPQAVNADSRGYYLTTRTGATASKMYKNGSTIITSALAVNVRTVQDIQIGSYQGSTLFTTRNLAFATIGSGMSDSEALTLYNIVQAFQTTLGRNV